MKDFIVEPVSHCGCDCIGPLEAEHIANATAYANLHTKLTVHVNDNDRHVTKEDKDRWDAKADKLQLDDLENAVRNKLDDIQIPEIDTSAFLRRSDLDDYVTESDLAAQLLALRSLISSMGNNTPDLSAYALKSELSNLGYIRTGAKLGTINGQDFYHNGSIQISTGTTTVEGGSVTSLDMNSNGTLTLNQTSGGSKSATISLDSLSNVSIKSPSANQVLTYKDGTWVNAAASSVPAGDYEQIIKPVQYDIRVLATTVAKSYSGDTASISGEIQYAIVRTEYTDDGSNISNINSGDNTYGVTSRVYLGPSSTGVQYNINYSGDHHVATLQSRTWDGAYTYSMIEVRLNGDVVATAVVPTIIPGQNGANGSDGQVQALTGEVMRMRGAWESNPSKPYRNGTTAEDGIKYTDVVIHGGCYFRCLVDSTSVEPDDETYSDNSGWAVFAPAGDSAFNYLIANNAYIKNLTVGNQIVLTNAQQEVVAGMASASYITEKGLNDDSTNGIRIWAGKLTNGNVASAPFTVDEEGHVKADSITFSGSAGYISWGSMRKNSNYKINPQSDNCISYICGSGMSLELCNPNNCKGAMFYIFNKSSDQNTTVWLSDEIPGNAGIFYISSGGTSTQSRRTILPPQQMVQMMSIQIGDDIYVWQCVTPNVLSGAV